MKKLSCNTTPRIAALMAALAVAAGFLGFDPPTVGLSASPVSSRDAYELLVTLEASEAGRFEYRVALSRSEFNDIRFEPRRAREDAIDKARTALAQKRGYFKKLYGEDADRMEKTRVLNVELIDVARNQRVSIMNTQKAI